MKYSNSQYKIHKLFFLRLLPGILGLLIGGCGRDGFERANEQQVLQVLATTTHLADLARQIGGDKIAVSSLMKPGVDPHSFRASAHDINRLHRADLVLYHGLALEGKIAQVLEGAKKSGHAYFSPCEEISAKLLIHTGDANQSVDPHLWFSPDLWIACAQSLSDQLAKVLPEYEENFHVNLEAFENSVRQIDQWGQSLMRSIPEPRRVLITSHDAFQYFGQHFKVKVVGLQGINTLVEAGLADRANLVDFIRRHQSPALFVESSVNPKALEEISKESGAVIGGTLFSDALGAKGQTVPGIDGKPLSVATWEGMMVHNLSTIAKALNKQL